jgi:hypothetical protein
MEEAEEIVICGTTSGGGGLCGGGNGGGDCPLEADERPLSAETTGLRLKERLDIHVLQVS